MIKIGHYYHRASAQSPGSTSYEIVSQIIRRDREGIWYVMTYYVGSPLEWWVDSFVEELTLHTHYSEISKLTALLLCGSLPPMSLPPVEVS